MLSGMNQSPPADRFTKTTFTVPTDTWVQLKKLTGDKTSRGFAPILGEPGVRFSRDRYISAVLAGELGNLSELPINSEAASRALAMEALDHRQKAPEEYTKINLSLASSVAADFTRIATEKRIPRDLLMSRFIEIVVRGLRKAAEIASNPFEDARIFHANPYSDLHLTEDDLIERKEADLAIYAIAALKKQPIYLVETAYWKLPRARRRELRNRPSVRAAMKKHRKEWAIKSDTPIDLSDLLPPSHRPRKPR